MTVDVTILFVTLLVGHVTAGHLYPPEGCGTPGVPGNGDVVYPSRVPPNGTGGGAPRYAVGDRVKYRCQEGHRVRGGEWRTCGAGGRWRGEPPFCSLDLAAKRPAQQSGTLLAIYPPGKAVDGDLNTCSFTSETPAPRWWQVSLGATHNVTRVSVTISPDEVQHFTVYVIELLEDNKALYKPCASYQGLFPSDTLELPCTGDGQRGSFVYIRDDRPEEKHLGLCEVSVYGEVDSACGLPDIPRNAEMTVENRTATFSCEEGYRLSGGNSLLCNHRGRWTGVAGRCEVIRCPLPSIPDHGGVTLSPPAPPAPPQLHLSAPRLGWVAQYRCDPGYEPQKPQTRVCGETGDWTGGTPLCQRLHCGPAPMVPYSQFSLINSSGIELVVYTCRGRGAQGAMPTFVSTCEPTGHWQTPNITCPALVHNTTAMLRNPLLKPRRPSGRALKPTFFTDAEVVLAPPNDGQRGKLSSAVSAPSHPVGVSSGSREMQLVTALAVVATLLLASVSVLFLFLAIYKKKRNTRIQNFSSPPESSSEPSKKQSVTPVMSYANEAFSSSTESMHRQATQSYSSSRNSLQSRPSVDSRTPSVHGSKPHLHASFKNTSESESTPSDPHEPPYETIIKIGTTALVTNSDESMLDEDEYLNQQLYHVICEPENAYGSASHKSENGYETVSGKLSGAVEPGYQTVSELADSKLENGYESLSEKGESGYEKIREIDHQYEALSERKHHGYETLKNIKNRNRDFTGNIPDANGSLKIKDSNSSQHEHSDQEETNCPKSPTVPDILQGISSDKESECEDINPVPPEILALYAQVDRSRKKKRLNNTASELQLIIKHIQEEDDLGGYEKLPNQDIHSNFYDKKPTPPPRPKNMVPFGTFSESSKDLMSDLEFNSDNDNSSSVCSYRTAPSSNFSTISGRSGEFFDLSSTRPLPPIPRT